MNLEATMSLDASRFTNPLAGAQSALATAVGGMKSSLGPLLALAGAASLGGAAVLGFKKAIDSAADAEAMQASLAVLTQSVSQAASMIGELRKISAATHLSLPGLGDAARTLLSFGLATDQVVPSLKKIGDVSGGNAQRFESLALVFGQTASAGKLMGQDLLQYINAGFNPLQEVSKRTGKSMGDLRKEVENGNISFAQVSQAFTDATSAGGRFFGFTATMAKTWGGLMGQLQNHINTLFREFGTPLIDSLKPFLTGAITLADQLSAKAREWGKTLAGAINVAYQLFKSGDFGKAAFLSLKIGFGQAVNFLAGALKGVFVASVSLLADAVKGAFKVFSNKDTFQGLDLVMTGVAQVLGAEIKKALIDAFSGVKIMGMNVIDPEAVKLLKGGADFQEQNGKINAQIGGDMLSSAFEGSGAAMFNSLIKGFDKFKAEIKDTKIIDTSAAQAELDKIITKAKASVAGARAAAAKAAPAAALNPAAADASGAVGKGAKLDDGDRLSKIGLFVGSGGPGIDLARRTANNTEKMVGLLTNSLKGGSLTGPTKQVCWN